MDNYQFVAKLVEVLAWPILIAGVIYLYRRQLDQLTARVKKLKVLELEADFGKSLEDAHIQAENLSARGENKNVPEIDANDKFLELATTHPDAAVLEAYKRIERFLVGIADQYPESLTKNPLALAGRLHDEGFWILTSLSWSKRSAIYETWQFI